MDERAEYTRIGSRTTRIRYRRCDMMSLVESARLLGRLVVRNARGSESIGTRATSFRFPFSAERRCLSRTSDANTNAAAAVVTGGSKRFDQSSLSWLRICEDDSQHFLCHLQDVLKWEAGINNIELLRELRLVGMHRGFNLEAGS